MAEPIQSSIVTTNLADILERVLDKGIVIAGDVKVCIADIELLTIQIRLIICSVERAKEIGINWWQGDSFLSSEASAREVELKKKIQSLEEKSPK